ncbi:MAG TPA: hypothetical protein VFQ25_03225 [Ktedonobacterales bacterium]|nr:hypothetical protein [Ktedonobacterales bacterium]
MSASSSSDRPSSETPRPSDAPPEERTLLCGECGLLFTSADIFDYCDNCGAPRCRSCAALANDDADGLYICSTCANALDAL